MRVGKPSGLVKKLVLGVLGIVLLTGVFLTDNTSKQADEVWPSSQQMESLK